MVHRDVTLNKLHLAGKMFFRKVDPASDQFDPEEVTMRRG
eukprot:CAMPEP_0118638172 /NCGR_PEP_ID=MMETSP0785-20121206/3537_1 /TAXON_ID=91992 /ORGANISM="Bolidomonas pacifica, Strain CCMP 1866" /LENGTH=39 /DNA_ID= /DNA_START= /DNA_END= /DNA_ORIENTATION=